MTELCHICRSSPLIVNPQSRAFVRVTSDCKPWPAGGQLGTCKVCGTVQAVVTEAWQADAEKIYRAYQVYHQGAGAEQAVFSTTGEGDTRSNRLVASLAVTINLPSAGHLLDIGCGNGNFLRTFGQAFPNWRLSGAEFDAKDVATLQKIPSFQKLHTSPLNEITEEFDLISLVHTLEHIENPNKFLKDIRRLLAPNGVLFVQVPYYRDNPFELMTADHASHFAPDTLASLLARSGFTPTLISTTWVGKEISAIAQAGEEESKNEDRSLERSGRHLEDCLDWLNGLVDRAAKVQARAKIFGLFGSSIAATWTAANLPHLPDFFIDEDPARAGRSHMDRPILKPSEIPTEAEVFIALQQSISERIFQRHNVLSPGRWNH